MSSEDAAAAAADAANSPSSQSFAAVVAYHVCFVAAVVGTLSVAFLIEWCFRASFSIAAIRKAGIPVLSIGWKTLVSLFQGEPEELFQSLTVDVKKGEKDCGLTGWLTPVGKVFLIVHDEKVLEQIIVANQANLTKNHAFGLLEHFRKTTLKDGDAWKVVHRIASKFPVKDAAFQAALQRMLSVYLVNIGKLRGVQMDFASFTRAFYWRLVLLMVFGDDGTETDTPAPTTKRGSPPLPLPALYEDAWVACIDALQVSLVCTIPRPLSSPYLGPLCSP
jgi:hypothetical protein